MSSWGSSKRAKARKAQRKLEATREIAQKVADWKVKAAQIYGTKPYDQLADETWNRHVVHWEAGELRANFDSEDESEGWVSLTRGDGRCMWYHPGTRRAFWTGFEPLVEFFVRDIEQYIHQKFYLP